MLIMHDSSVTIGISFAISFRHLNWKSLEKMSETTS